MTKSEFEKLFNMVLDKVVSIYYSKGKEYQINSEQEDVLSNFKQNGNMLGISPYTVWAVYFNKHVTSILNAIKENPHNPQDSLSESMLSRVTDIMLYSCLLLALSKDLNE